jgi:DNA primase large subunit
MWLLEHLNKLQKQVLESKDVRLAEVEFSALMRKELVGFAHLILFLNAHNERFYVNKISVMVAKLLQPQLFAMDEEVLKAVASRLHIEVREGWCVPITTFVKFSPHDPAYALTQFDVDKGLVWLDKQAFVRVLVGGLERFLQQPRSVELRASSELMKVIAQHIPKPNITFKRKGDPPCMQALLQRLRNHENLPHYARWILALYLLHIGVSEDEIVNLFSHSPDFNERITRYHVRFLKDKRYKMPSCHYIRELGFCVKDCGVKNPLQWKHGQR